MPDKDKMAMLTAQHRRRFPSRGPTPRGAEVLSAITSMAMNCAGGLVVELRLAARPCAPWRDKEQHSCAISRRDRRGWYAGAGNFHIRTVTRAWRDP